MLHSLKIAFFVTVWITAQMSPALGCLNPPEDPVNVGQPIYTEDLGPQAYIWKLTSGHLSAQDWEYFLADLIRAKRREPVADAENSKAVALIHLGRTDEALKILEKLEKETLGSYSVAANLGTAYELVGDNERAYEWIAKSMDRNPESHFGTEWLHLKILRTKEEIKKDPKWMETNSVLGINWDSVGGDLSKVQVAGERGQLYTAETVRKAIEYQLHERTEFVKPPDPTVASLLYDLSHLVRHSRSPEHGDLVLAASQNYGYAPALTQSPAAATEIIPSVPKTSYWLPAGIVAGILAVLALAVIWGKTRRVDATK